MRPLRTAIFLFLALTAVTGLAYPLALTAVARLVWPERARGSLVVREGIVVGSDLVGQAFDDAGFFWGRPSATSPPYHAAASSGSNWGPSNPALHDAVRARIERLRAMSPGVADPIPVDLVTASGSGLDPHVSPAAALWQVPRVARARGMAATEVRALVEAHVEGRTLGVLGEPRVNVLRLNLALLDAMRR